MGWGFVEQLNWWSREDKELKGENEVMDGKANAQESEVNSDESLEAKYLDAKFKDYEAEEATSAATCCIDTDL